MARLPQVNGDDGIWGQILNDYLLVSHNADGSEKATGGTLPDWFQSGSNIPVGQVTPAQKGALYQDTTNGGLYEAIGTSNSDWVQLGGGPGPEGLGVTTDQYGDTVVTGGASGSAVLSDIGGLAGTGNGFYWVTNGTDGEQSARMTLGSTGQHVHHWNADGSIDFAGAIGMSAGNNVAGYQSNAWLIDNVGNNEAYSASIGGGINSKPPTGISAFTANSGSGGTVALDADSMLISNVQDPAGAQDAATKHYVDTNAAVTAAKIESTFTGAGLVYQGTGAGTGALKYPPGYEVGYDQITSTVNITSTTLAAPTSVITCAAHTFDGSAVVLEVSSALFYLGTITNNPITVTLWESGTQLAVLAMAVAGATNSQQLPLRCSYRFTPSAGSHTYTIAAITGSTTGTPLVAAGSGGTGSASYAPAYARFTKV